MAAARKITVDTTLPAEIVIGATKLVGLAQEIRTVLTTRKGSVPLDRDFGVSWDYVDRPQPVAMQKMIAEISVQLTRYVPRITVDSIAFKTTGEDVTMEGHLYPVVTCSIKEAYLGDFR